jgi:cyclopropane fatty-acyl-phospholipid synthase-like methyltransferase
MKENKYDDIEFFHKYGEMPRSIGGLEAAGEWPALKQILPDFNNKNVLDLGCGYGWHCRYAIENNARMVVGVDISVKMLEKAKSMTKEENIQYIRKSIEEIEFTENSFDIIISSLAFHYIESYNELIKKIYKWLNKNGNFIFSIEHPIFTAYGNQDWIYGEDNKILHWPIDNYFYEGKRDAMFLENTITKYHRTLTTYLNTLLKEGFKINNIIEPKPDENNKEMKNELRRPMMLIVGVTKE